MRTQSIRVRTREGDWYVATSQKNWKRAFKRMREQVEAREARMAAWEAERDRTAPDYWAAYRAEKAKTPVSYPMPEGHVMFRGLR